MNTLDLFAGPGGWDVAAHALGLVPLGVELDAAACLTREAAGLATLQADVSLIDPRDHLGVELLIGSPPCPTFSTAGDRAGGSVVEQITECMGDLCEGRDTRARHRVAAYEALLPTAKSEKRARRDAAMSLLVVEPLRFLLEIRPARIALEQVPPVLPLWEHLATLIRGLGYSTWTGVLTSEQFGVPQTRSRAFLLATLEGRAAPPAPTHQRYIPAPREQADADRLFDPGPRGRIVAAGDEGLLPWVSMAEALGWGDGRVGFARLNDVDDGASHRERDFRDVGAPAQALTEKTRSWELELGDAPAKTLCGHHTPRWLYNGNQSNSTVRGDDEPASTILFGHRANDVRFVQRERSGDRAAEGFDPGESPAQALTSKARSWSVHDQRSEEFNRGPVDPGEQPSPSLASTARQWTVRTGDQSMAHSRDPADAIPYERDVDAPAPTLDRKVGSAWKVEERPAPTITGTRRSEDGMLAGRQLPDGEGRNVGGKGWTGDRPATTVAGDPRVSPPVHHGDGEQGKDAVSSAAVAAGADHVGTAVRITVPEASVLQGFPPNYPWQGSRTKQFEQIGNAVPPPFAYAILRALLP